MEILSKPILLQIVGIFACKYFHNFFFFLMKMNCLVKMHSMCVLGLRLDVRDTFGQLKNGLKKLPEDAG